MRSVKKPVAHRSRQVSFAGGAVRPQVLSARCTVTLGVMLRSRTVCWARWSAWMGCAGLPSAASGPEGGDGHHEGVGRLAGGQRGCGNKGELEGSSCGFGSRPGKGEDTTVVACGGLRLSPRRRGSEGGGCGPRSVPQGAHPGGERQDLRRHFPALLLRLLLPSSHPENGSRFRVSSAWL